MTSKPILIDHREGSFSDIWIEYCKQNQIPYKIVNCETDQIVEIAKDSSGLLWHWSHTDVSKALFARNLTYALEAVGIKVFPSYDSCWNFDNKLAQKYQLEALDLPLVKTWAFYEQQKALDWSKTTSYPKVFKLRCGAGSSNVLLVRTAKQASKLIKKMFKSGIPKIGRKSIWLDSLAKLKSEFSFANILRLAKATIRLVIKGKFEKYMGNEKGYAYFQDFIDGADHDLRIVVIGNRAIGIKRSIRENDFRASGSGKIQYDKSLFSDNLLKLAFQVAEKTKSQCIAIDFIPNNEQYSIIETSYGFAHLAYHDCQGYWDKDLTWHDKPVRPAIFIIEDFLQNQDVNNHE